MSPLRFASCAVLRLLARRISGLLAVLLVASVPCWAASFPCTTSSLILSAQNGSLTNPATWVGGSVPTDGSCIVIRHHVTLDGDLGTEGGAGLGWIRIENGATFDSDCVAPHTIYFGSTGANPIGSGSNLNPGADASMFGFFVSFGSLNLACAQPNNISITSADENHPWYIHHQSGDYAGCTRITNNVCNGLEAFHGSALNLQHTALNHLGTSALYFNGIDWDMTSLRTPANTLNVSYNWVRDLYGIVADGNNFQANAWTVASNWFDAPRPDPNRGVLYFYSSPTNWTVADNTVTNPVTSSYLLNAPHNGVGMQILRNAVLGSPQVPFAIAFTQAAIGRTNSYNYNLCVNPEPLQQARVPCLIVGSGNGDTSTTMSYNVIQGGHSGISQIGTTSFNPTISYNWVSQWKEDSNGQGAIITRTGVVTETYNVLVMENSSSTLYMIGNLGYTSTNYDCNATVQQDHNTLYGVTNPTGNPNINFLWGDGVTSPHTCVVNSYARSNIAYGTNLGMVNENNDNTWNLSPAIAYGGAAVHHNVVFAASRAYYLNTQTTPGFDNGTVHHPNQAQYGDLTVDPRFFDTTRRPAGYDAVCGGPGTNENLFLSLAMRSGFGGIYNGCYNVAALSTWIRQGWAPRNARLMGAAHDGTFIGALPPVGNPLE